MVKKRIIASKISLWIRQREIMRKHHLEFLSVVDDNLRVIGTVGLRDLAADASKRNK